MNEGLKPSEYWVRHERELKQGDLFGSAPPTPEEDAYASGFNTGALLALLAALVLDIVLVVGFIAVIKAIP